MPEEFPVRPGNDSAPDRGPSPGGSADFEEPTGESATPGTGGEGEPTAPGVDAEPEPYEPDAPNAPDAPDAGPADAGPPELVSEP